MTPIALDASAVVWLVGSLLAVGALILVAT